MHLKINYFKKILLLYYMFINLMMILINIQQCCLWYNYKKKKRKRKGGQVHMGRVEFLKHTDFNAPIVVNIFEVTLTVLRCSNFCQALVNEKTLLLKKTNENGFNKTRSYTKPTN